MDRQPAGSMLGTNEDVLQKGGWSSKLALRLGQLIGLACNLVRYAFGYVGTPNMPWIRQYCNPC